MKRFSRWAMVVTAAVAMVISAGAQEKPAAAEVTKKAKKKAAEVAAEQKPATETAKPAVADVAKKTKKKAEAAVEEKKAPAAAEAAKTTAPVAEKSGTAKAAAAKTAAPYTGGVVNLNTATKAQLEALPGVGEANANHIIKGRPYKSADELVTRKIVQERYYNAFKAHVTAK